jgi:hypothetical protein
MTYFILIFVIGLIAPALDVYSSLKGKNERNRRFRNPDGTTNIPKLILWKFGYYAVAGILLGVAYAYEPNLIPVFIFVLISTIVLVPIIIGNFKAK